MLSVGETTELYNDEYIQWIGGKVLETANETRERK
jgi:hypothetical protein